MPCRHHHEVWHCRWRILPTLCATRGMQIQAERTLQRTLQREAFNFNCIVYYGSPEPPHVKNIFVTNFFFVRALCQSCWIRVSVSFDLRHQSEQFDRLSIWLKSKHWLKYFRVAGSELPIKTFYFLLFWTTMKNFVSIFFWHEEKVVLALMCLTSCGVV